MGLAAAGHLQKARRAWVAVIEPKLPAQARAQFLLLDDQGRVVALVDAAAKAFLAGKEANMAAALRAKTKAQFVKSVELLESDRATAELAVAFNELFDSIG